MDGVYRILLADGDESFRSAMTEVLRKANYACDCANDAGEATAMIAAEPPYDALILDAEMAGNSRLELVRMASETASGLPVILVTAHPTLEIAVNAIHLPVEAYLVKPIKYDDLHPYLRRSVARCRLYRAVTDAKQRVARWNDAAGRLQDLLLEPLDGHLPTLVGALLTATFDNIVKSVVDLRRVINVLASTDDAAQRTETAEMLGKMDLTRAALQETVNALEETKHSFKSKRLGELRRQLQALLAILEQE